MPALVPGQRKIGDLVPPVSGSFEPRGGGVQVLLGKVAGRPSGAGARRPRDPGGEGGRVGQVVQGDVRWPGGDRGIDVGRRLHPRLTGNAEDEIEVPLPQPPAGHGRDHRDERLFDLALPGAAAESGAQPGRERLDAQRDAG